MGFLFGGIMDETTPVAEPVEPIAAEPAADTGEGAPAQEATFMDPAQIPSGKEDDFKRMQAAFTKQMQKYRIAKDAEQIVQRFNTDADFARQTILQRAAQLGMTLGNPGAPSGPPVSSTMPPQLVEAVKANLSPELQWMAPALAASQWAGMQMALQPIQENQARTAQYSANQEREAAEMQLSEKVPGWEQHEDEMNHLQAFLASPKLTDRRWGNKLELLHRLVVGNGQATAEAARRMAQAVRSRNPAGSPTAMLQPNVSEQVTKATTNQDAWSAAAKFAQAEMVRQGIKL